VVEEVWGTADGRRRKIGNRKQKEEIEEYKGKSKLGSDRKSVKKDKVKEYRSKKK
jgi:hypothetical protein